MADVLTGQTCPGRRGILGATQPIDDLLPGFIADGHHASPPAEWPRSVEETMAREETRRIVRECIDRLPESYRIVLVLRDVQEMEMDEVASCWG